MKPMTTIRFIPIILLASGIFIACGAPEAQTKLDKGVDATPKAVSVVSNSEIYDTWFVPGKLFGNVELGTSQEEVLKSTVVKFEIQGARSTNTGARVDLPDGERILIYNNHNPEGKVEIQMHDYFSKDKEKVKACYETLVSQFTANYGQGKVETSDFQPRLEGFKWDIENTHYVIFMDGNEVATGWDSENKVKLEMEWSLRISRR
jgi:hypothetical protein